MDIESVAKRKRVIVDVDEWESARVIKAARRHVNATPTSRQVPQPEVIDLDEWEARRPQQQQRRVTPPPSCLQRRRTVSSPFRLTRIPGLPERHNRDTVTLSDLVGDPLISECWNFNFVHNIPFFLGHFHRSTQASVAIHIVYGYHDEDNPLMTSLKAQQKDHRNTVELHRAYVPKYGTHHSKMMILFRRDHTAQVVIHTANMTNKDWAAMTNGVWVSPRLPRLPAGEAAQANTTPPRPYGTGSRFKYDMLAYLAAYDKARRESNVGPLVRKLREYDFSPVRAAFVATVPGWHPSDDGSVAGGVPHPCWGWPGLRNALKAVPVTHQGPGGEASEIVIQVSAISTITEPWLRKCLLGTLATNAGPGDSDTSASPSRTPALRIVFPTVDNIRSCVGGYSSGNMVVMRGPNKKGKDTLHFLRPWLSRWDNAHGGVAPAPFSPTTIGQNSGRGRVAPHIKTYVRLTGSTVDWALLTSANLSTQAWGGQISKKESSGKVFTSSWEVGVLVWPGILGDDRHAKMVGVFGTDTPPYEQSDARNSRAGNGAPLIGLRLPYSLPLQNYSSYDKPWISVSPQSAPDVEGNIWDGRIH